MAIENHLSLNAHRFLDLFQDSYTTNWIPTSFPLPYGFMPHSQSTRTEDFFEDVYWIMQAQQKNFLSP